MDWTSFQSGYISNQLHSRKADACIDTGSTGRLCGFHRGASSLLVPSSRFAALWAFSSRRRIRHSYLRKILEILRFQCRQVSSWAWHSAWVRVNPQCGTGPAPVGRQAFSILFLCILCRDGALTSKNSLCSDCVICPSLKKSKIAEIRRQQRQCIA